MILQFRRQRTPDVALFRRRRRRQGPRWMMAPMMDQCHCLLKGISQALKLWNSMPKPMPETMDMQFHLSDRNGGTKLGQPVANTLWAVNVQRNIETVLKDNDSNVKNPQLRRIARSPSMRLGMKTAATISSIVMVLCTRHIIMVLHWILQCIINTRGFRD